MERSLAFYKKFLPSGHVPIRPLPGTIMNVPVAKPAAVSTKLSIE